MGGRSGRIIARVLDDNFARVAKYVRSSLDPPTARETARFSVVYCHRNPEIGGGEPSPWRNGMTPPTPLCLLILDRWDPGACKTRDVSRESRALKSRVAFCKATVKNDCDAKNQEERESNFFFN